MDIMVQSIGPDSSHGCLDVSCTCPYTTILSRHLDLHSAHASTACCASTSHRTTCGLALARWRLEVVLEGADGCIAGTFLSTSLHLRLILRPQFFEAHRALNLRHSSEWCEWHRHGEFGCTEPHGHVCLKSSWVKGLAALRPCNIGSWKILLLCARIPSESPT